MRLEGADASLTLGAAGVHGDLMVVNSAGMTVLTYHAATGEFTLGASGSGGEVIIRDVAAPPPVTKGRRREGTYASQDS
ncbi:MAG TPA: hypothetical protein VGR26_15850 [Acidimicrobiales bacterium]|nr:hypothetical protein [Acidimicrobiales bacterium]